jgi:uncharacterized membrane protein
MKQCTCQPTAHKCCGATTHAIQGLPTLARHRHIETRNLPASKATFRCVAGLPRSRFTTPMSPITRRVLQAVLYEVIAIAVVGPTLSFAFDEPPASTFGLAVVLSTVALTWNYVFNWIFERWESAQAVRGRSFARRLAHGAGFEGGLVVILIPVMSLWLDISPAAAFVANLSLLVFFFVYAIAFTWTFDRVFGLPASAVQKDAKAIRA